MSLNDELDFLFSKTPKGPGTKIAPRLNLPVPINSMGARAVGGGLSKILGPLGTAVTLYDINRRVNKANSDFATKQAGQKFIDYLDNVGATLDAQSKMKGSPSKFVRDVLSTPGLNQATIDAYKKLQSGELKPASKPSKKTSPVKGVAKGNITKNSYPKGSVTQDMLVGGSYIPYNESLEGGEGLPPLPDNLPVDGVSVAYNSTYGGNSYPGGKLGPSLGINYTDPITLDDLGIIDPAKLQQIRDTYSLSPDDYLGMYKDDYRRIGEQALANKWSRMNVAPYSELAARQGLQNYLKEGYDLEQNIVNTNRALREAYAMGQATGLPASYFIDPKNALQYVIEPLIKGQQQREGFRVLLGNDIAVQQLKNEMEKYKTDAKTAMANEQRALDEKMGLANNNAKLLQAFGQSAMFFPEFTGSDLLNVLGSGMTPEMYSNLMQYVQQHIQSAPNAGPRNGLVNQAAAAQAMQLLFGGNR